MTHILIVVAVILGGGLSETGDIEVSTHRFESAEACGSAVAGITQASRLSVIGSRYQISAFCVKDKNREKK